MTHYDRIRLDFTSDVPDTAKSEILENIERIASENSLFVYQRFDKYSAAWSLDITAHDRKHDLSDKEIIGYLKSISEEKRVSIESLLKAAMDSKSGGTGG